MRKWNIYTEDDLECGMKYTDAPGVKLEDISEFPKELKKTSVKGANEIYEKVGGSGYKFGER